MRVIDLILVGSLLWTVVWGAIGGLLSTLKVTGPLQDWSWGAVWAIPAWATGVVVVPVAILAIVYYGSTRREK